MSSSRHSRTGRHAVVIGINHYPKISGADLRGCLNDAALIERLLIERFDFPQRNVGVLRDAQATRDAIRSAFAGLEERLEDGDVAVVYFAGHGSRMRDPYRRGCFIESLVPHDSGRNQHPNRDLPDWEIDRWVRRWNVRTPNVVLIFDCCHSGAVTRGALAENGAIEKVREAPIDERTSEEIFGGESPGWADGDSPPTAVARGPSGWLPSGHRALLLAACRGEEFAGEHRLFRDGRVLRHGAFTYFFGRHLEGAKGQITWRAVHSEVAPAVSAVHRRQHPQIEGRADVLIFGTREVAPTAHLTVVEVDDSALVLAGGAAHGLVLGERFAILPAGAAIESGELATVKVTEVAATRSRALLEAPPRGELRAGQWAILQTSRSELETRYLRWLELEKPDSSSLASDRVELAVLGADGAERSVFTAGERAEIRLSNRHEEPLFMNLLEFGTDGRIEVLLPKSGHPTYRPGGLRLEAGATLQLAADYYRLDPRFRVEVAEGLVLRPPVAGMLHLKLFATTAPADFEFLTQPPSRGPGKEPFTDLEDWTVVTVAVTVKAAKPVGEPLDGNKRS